MTLENYFPTPAILQRLHHLESVTDRIKAFQTAQSAAQGLLDIPNGELLPQFVNRSRNLAFQRAERQTQTLGPEILRLKTSATLGDVTTNLEPPNDRMQQLIDEIDIRAVTRHLLETYLIGGVTAAYTNPTPDGFTITRLGGYVEPYTNPNDVDVTTGLFQAVQTTKDTITVTGDRRERRMTWRVRTWDFDDNPPNTATMREWRNLTLPTNLADTPSETIPNAPRPRFRIRALSQNALPLGEMQQATPFLLALLATDIRLVMSEELSAFPILKTIGEVDFEAVGPAEVIAADENADATWMQPGNLNELREQRRERAERVRQALSLPGGFLGNDSPSGEALTEANIRFRMNAETYARDLAGLLTELLQDAARIIGYNGTATGNVTPSGAFDVNERVQRTLSAFNQGVIPIDVAARELQSAFPTWSDENLERWIEQQNAALTPDDVTNFLTNEET